MERFAKSVYSAALCGLVFAASGCAAARTVAVRPGEGGVVALQPGVFGDARLEAQKRMNANCGDQGYKIVEEGEEVIGTTSETDTNFIGPFGVSNTTSQNRTEWRICYECAGIRKPSEPPSPNFDPPPGLPSANGPPPLPPTPAPDLNMRSTKRTSKSRTAKN